MTGKEHGTGPYPLTSLEDLVFLRPNAPLTHMQFQHWSHQRCTGKWLYFLHWILLSHDPISLLKYSPFILFWV